MLELKPVPPVNRSLPDVKASLEVLSVNSGPCTETSVSPKCCVVLWQIRLAPCYLWSVPPQQGSLYLLLYHLGMEERW